MLQNTLFFDSPLEIAYSINKSKATHLQEGTYRSSYLASNTMKDYNSENMMGPLLPPTATTAGEQQNLQIMRLAKLSHRQSSWVISQ